MTPHASPARKAGLAVDQGLGARRPGRAPGLRTKVPRPNPRARTALERGGADSRAGAPRFGSRSPPLNRRRRGRRPPKTGAVCSQPLEFEQNQKIKIFTGFHSPRLPAGGGIAAP
jgi:hypothetical protein